MNQLQLPQRAWTDVSGSFKGLEVPRDTCQRWNRVIGRPTRWNHNVAVSAPVWLSVTEALGWDSVLNTHISAEWLGSKDFLTLLRTWHLHLEISKMEEIKQGYVNEKHRAFGSIRLTLSAATSLAFPAIHGWISPHMQLGFDNERSLWRRRWSGMSCLSCEQREAALKVTI